MLRLSGVSDAGTLVKVSALLGHWFSEKTNYMRQKGNHFSPDTLGLCLFTSPIKIHWLVARPVVLQKKRYHLIEKVESQCALDTGAIGRGSAVPLTNGFSSLCSTAIQKYQQKIPEVNSWYLLSCELSEYRDGIGVTPLCPHPPQDSTSPFVQRLCSSHLLSLPCIVTTGLCSLVHLLLCLKDRWVRARRKNAPCSW